MARRRVDHHSGPGAFDMARKQSKHGHHDWIVWTDNDGVQQARRVSQAHMKECLLATGTAGRWYLIGASDGVGMIGRWRMGINILYQLRCGLR